jgi:hypothetical protein
MKQGDWVIVEALEDFSNSGGVGEITVIDYIDNGWHLVDFQDNTFAKLIHKDRMTLLNPAVSDILNSIGTVPNTNERK